MSNIVVGGESTSKFERTSALATPSGKTESATGWLVRSNFAAIIRSSPRFISKYFNVFTRQATNRKDATLRWDGTRQWVIRKKKFAPAFGDQRKLRAADQIL